MKQNYPKTSPTSSMDRNLQRSKKHNNNLPAENHSTDSIFADVMASKAEELHTLEKPAQQLTVGCTP
jgi:hypothetical protein